MPTLARKKDGRQDRSSPHEGQSAEGVRVLLRTLKRVVQRGKVAGPTQDGTRRVTRRVFALVQESHRKRPDPRARGARQ